jgi:hypothetical protein
MSDHPGTGATCPEYPYSLMEDNTSTMKLEAEPCLGSDRQTKIVDLGQATTIWPSAWSSSWNTDKTISEHAA